MNINLVAIGTKMPAWVTAGYQEYAKRLPKEFNLQLTEIVAQKRSKNANISQLLEYEGKQLQNAVPMHHQIVALERQGKVLSTQELAHQLQQFHHRSQDISIWIGGPEGIAPSALQHAQHCWSLSALTLPHPLVRILIAEQIYRAWSMLTHHPYHR